MTEQTPFENALTDRISAFIAEATECDSPNIVDGYIVLASYRSLDNRRPLLFTWWGDQPNWESLGMLEGAITYTRDMVLDQFNHDLGGDNA